MVTTFGQTRDKFSTTTASAYTAGDGSLVLASGAGTTLGSLPANRKWRFTAGSGFGTGSEAILGVFEATGRSTDTLTGVTAAANYSDVNLPSGTHIEIRWTRDHADELQSAINTLESATGGTIGGAVSGGTAGRVLFEGPGPVLADSADLAWTGTSLVLPGGFAVGAGSHGTPGASSTAIGDSAVASGDYSTALGTSTSATATGAVAVGRGAVATDQNAFALGAGATAAYPYSVAIGVFAATETGFQLVVGSAFGFAAISEWVANADASFTLTGRCQSSTSVPRNAGRVVMALDDATDATRQGRIALLACDSTGTDREGVRVASDGTQAKIGFYGATPVAKASAPTTLADVIALLHALGLCS